MSMSLTATSPPSAGENYTARLVAALRGGLILMAGSALWGFAMRGNNGQFFELGFFWLPCAWIVFPAGALIDFVMSRWIAGRGWGWPDLSIRMLVGADSSGPDWFNR
jgi:hypothetical protein